MGANAKQGAVARKIRFTERRDAWFRHHKMLAVDSLVQMLKKPLSSMLTWLVIAIALSIPALMYLFLLNIQSLVEPLDEGAQLTVYLKKSVSDHAGLGLAEDLNQRPEIFVADFISAQQGLDDFKAYSGLGDVIDSLDSNPLPGVIVVQPVNDDLVAVESLKILLESLSDVTEVKIDLVWVQRINQMSQLAENLVGFLSMLFSMAVLLVVGNTIRLAIESRKEEILVVKLVGGTNAFVRRPFLYMGFWFGLAGGLVAWLFISICYFVLRDPAEKLFLSLGDQYPLIGLNFGGVLLLLFASIFISLLGSVLAVGRHIKAIEPT